MKRVLFALIVSAGFMSLKADVNPKMLTAISQKTQAKNADVQKEWICGIDIMGESAFTRTYPTQKECNQFCKGIGRVCEETAESKKASRSKAAREATKEIVD